MAIRFESRVASAILTVAALARAAAPAAQSYDVRDLLVAVPDYAAGVAPATQPSRAAAGEAFASVVRGALPKDVTVQFNGATDRLDVTADAEGQSAVRQLLEQARADRNRQILTGVDVLTVDAAVLAALPDALARRVAAAAVDGGRRPAELTDAEVAAIIARPGVTRLTAPRLTTFDGQSAYVAVTSEHAFVGSLNRKTGVDGAVVYEPKVDTLHDGLTLTVRDRTAADGAAVAVDLTCDLTRLLKVDNVQQEGGTVQRPQVRTDHFAGLQLVPRGKTLLIRPATATTDTGPQTLLLLKAAAVTPPSE